MLQMSVAQGNHEIGYARVSKDDRVLVLQLAALKKRYPSVWASCQGSRRRFSRSSSPFLMLAASFWPYMIPSTVTVWDAAAPPQSLEFLFWRGGLVVFPVVLVYTGAVFWIFRCKLGMSHMG